ncbi:hypothetical protein ACFWIO_35705 [Streptomyces diastatochromogenes]|uniref:hypothetical protein n=1 Tax=Streptomyces diastatochromogenes TaxID=42236 RepID=UPI0036656713
MSNLTAFELLLRASDVRLPSAWQAAWDEAEDILAIEHPEGYDVTEVGRLAYDSLHDDLKPAARDALFYGWWEAEQDRKARRMADAQRDPADIRDLVEGGER